MVNYCGFSERVFEFAFNSEFARKHHSVLVGCPQLPTQQAEKSLGYDVKLRIKQLGGAVSSLFLQHKVCRFVERRNGSNKHLYGSIGGPYFAFPVDPNQYNVLLELARKRIGGVYYCAPCFTTRDAIDENFTAHRVTDESIWIDVSGAGRIADQKRHCVVFSPDARKAVRHSAEPVPLPVFRPAPSVAGQKRYEDGLHEGELSRLYETVYETAQEWLPTMRSRRQREPVDSDLHPPAFLPQRIVGGEPLQLIEQTSDILARYFGLSWLIVGRHGARKP